MKKNHTLCITWREEKFEKLDDETLKNMDKEIYNFATNSKENQIVFENSNAVKLVKTKAVYGLVGLAIVYFLIVLLGHTDNDFLIDKIAPVMLIGLGVGVLGFLAIPFTTYKQIIFELDKQYYQSRILKKNVLGLNSVALNFEFPQPIERIVINETTSYKYITFREKHQDKISGSAPIIICESNNAEDYNYIINLLEEMVKYSSRDIKLVTLK
ncbi:hypothetical protein [Flavobacterium sp.]|uniref:hypothetical protein n=1 Tax=Flavobacterium sp. TaxID=239 RepID=UPI003528C9C3